MNVLYLMKSVGNIEEFPWRHEKCIIFKNLEQRYTL